MGSGVGVAKCDSNCNMNRSVELLSPFTTTLNFCARAFGGSSASGVGNSSKNEKESERGHVTHLFAITSPNEHVQRALRL
jgi:hypothetical protein